ncbi:hypothetical protein HYW87_04615 [Candidatus Roizmanbacteria bacterium]|nr:hypothetical protein [Candidatus Roizmanbacteria bacterium]
MRRIIDYIWSHKLLLLIIIPAFFLYMLVIFPSGSYFCFEGECGYYFWGVHGRDAIWHLAIAETSFNKFPFVAPTFVGGHLYGYNWLLDFIIFLLSKLGIPPLISYFKLIPVVWFIFFTILLSTLARKIIDSPLFVGIFLFFSYFAGSFSYFFTLYYSKNLQNSSTLLPQSIMHTMSNLQYAVSLLFFIILLILVKDKKINKKIITISGILIFFMLGIKFYGALIGIFLLTLYLIVNISKIKIKNFLVYSFVISAFVLIGLFLFYDPLSTSKTGSTFSLIPFALVHTITESPDQFYLQKMTDARYFLQQFGIGPRLIAIELINLLIFLFFYLGTRFFGLLYVTILLVRKQLDKFDFVVISTILFSILLTVSLVQKGVWWNVVQFFFYAIFLSTIYLARLTYDFFKSKRKFFLSSGLILILLSVPTSYDLIWHFLKVSKSTYLPKGEIDALTFLKKQPDGVVFTPLYKKGWKEQQKNPPLNQYEDSSYVSAFSGKQQYLAEIQSMSVTSIPFEKRLEKVRKMDCSILNEVNYVYELKELTKKDKILSRCSRRNVIKIYNGASVSIYKLE